VPDPKLGATGEFPEGKISPHDEGALNLAIGHDAKRVYVNFGTPVMSLGMGPEQALNLAALIVQHAMEIKGHGRPSRQ
jgi:hypothetical protein